MWIAIPLGILLSIAIAVAWIRTATKRQVKRSLSFLSEVAKVRPIPTPATITPRPSPNASWDHPKIAKIARALRKNGLEPVGVMELEEVPGLEVYPMLQKNGACYALICRLVDADLVWFEFNAIEQSELVLNLSSTPLLKAPTVRPGKESRNVTDYDPDLAYFAFLRMCKGRELKKLTVDSMMEQLDVEWKASFAYSKQKKEQGASATVSVP